MKILTRAASIRSAIRELLSDPEGERIIAVAYVGADALSFLPAPKGLAIYCWPQAGGTNPYGVEALIRAGCNVHFVDRLHAKVYWSRTRGALIGSANLTANALGEQAHHEVAVLLPRGAFGIHAFLDSLRVEPNFDAALRRLHEAHVRFLQRNPIRKSSGSSTPLPSLRDWFVAGDRRAEWCLGWYEENDNPPRDAVRALQEETGSPKFADFLGCARRSDLTAGIFALSFRARIVASGTKLTKFNWWVPEIPSRTNVKAWQAYPYLWFACKRIPHGARPPFDAQDGRFQAALQEAINESGGLAWLRGTSLKPSKLFLERINRSY